MYSICSLDKNDVLNSIVAMKQRGYRGPIVQTSRTDYERLKYQRNGVRDFADSLLERSLMLIDLSTNTLHVQSCSQISSRVHDIDVVSCYIIDPNTTGLKLCSCCSWFSSLIELNTSLSLVEYWDRAFLIDRLHWWEVVVLQRSAPFLPASYPPWHLRVGLRACP